MDEERRPLLGRQFAARHGDELQMRDEERAEQIRRLLPYLPLGQVGDEHAAPVGLGRRDIRNQDAPVVHREGEIEFRRGLPEDVAQDGRGRDLPDLVEDGGRGLGLKALVVARVLLAPEPRDDRVGNARHDAPAKLVVGVEPRQVDERRPRTREQRGHAIEQKMLKPRPPALGPQVLEGRDDAGGGQRVAFRRNARQRIEAHRKLGVGDIEIAHLVRPLRRQGVDNGFGQVAMRVDDGRPPPPRKYRAWRD